MRVMLSPRLDAASELTPRLRPVGADKRLAKAEGLTIDEAEALATWLKSAGYGSIEVVHQGDHAGVQWRR